MPPAPRVREASARASREAMSGSGARPAAAPCRSPLGVGATASRGDKPAAPGIASDRRSQVSRGVRAGPEHGHKGLERPIRPRRPARESAELISILTLRPSDTESSISSARPLAAAPMPFQRESPAVKLASALLVDDEEVADAHRGAAQLGDATAPAPQIRSRSEAESSVTARPFPRPRRLSPNNRRKGSISRPRIGFRSL